MAKEKENKFAGIAPNLHTYLNNVKFMRTPKGATIDTSDLFMTFLKNVLTKFKKADQDAVVALLEIVEKEYFVGVNNIAEQALEVEETKYKIGQNVKNRTGQERFIIAIHKESKKGEIQYEWIDTTKAGVGSVCSEKTLIGWLEK